MSRLLGAARFARIVGVVALLASGPAAAQEIPRGQLGMTAVFRRNLGELADRYAFGYLWGFVAGYQVTRPDERLSIGLLWTTLWGRSQFYDFQTLNGDDPTVADGALKYFELSMGVRFRYAVTDAVPLYLVASGGGALLRTNVPIAPDAQRLHAGGYTGLGVDYYLGALLIGLDTRYGLIGEAPRSVSFMLSAGLGR
jgi:hypothetical protein